MLSTTPRHIFRFSSRRGTPDDHRRLARAPPGRSGDGANIIAVAFGKGGVGKPGSPSPWRTRSPGSAAGTLLFDGDLGLANVDIQLGLMPQHDLGGVLAGRLSLAQATLPFAPGGFDIVAGRSGCGRLAGVPAARLTKLGDDLAATAAGDDYVILDLGAGLERTVRELTRLAGTCVIVTTDEPPRSPTPTRSSKDTRLQDAGADIRHRRQPGELGARRRTDLRRPLRALELFLHIAPPLLGWSDAIPRCAKPSAARPACSPASRPAPPPPTSKPSPRTSPPCSAEPKPRAPHKLQRKVAAIGVGSVLAKHQPCPLHARQGGAR